MQYYKPWELLPDQEATIKSQIEEAEAIVEREDPNRADRDSLAQDPGGTTNATDEDGSAELKASETVGSEANPAEPSDAPLEKSTNPEVLSSEAPPEPVQVSNGGKDAGDDNGEVVVEADEDTVIY